MSHFTTPLCTSSYPPASITWQIMKCCRLCRANILHHTIQVCITSYDSTTWLTNFFSMMVHTKSIHVGLEHQTPVCTMTQNTSTYWVIQTRIEMSNTYMLSAPLLSARKLKCSRQSLPTELSWPDSLPYEVMNDWTMTELSQKFMPTGTQQLTHSRWQQDQ